MVKVQKFVKPFIFYYQAKWQTFDRLFLFFITSVIKIINASQQISEVYKDIFHVVIVGQVIRHMTVIFIIISNTEICKNNSVSNLESVDLVLFSCCCWRMNWSSIKSESIKTGWSHWQPISQSLAWRWQSIYTCWPNHSEVKENSLSLSVQPIGSPRARYGPQAANRGRLL